VIEQRAGRIYLRDEVGLVAMSESAYDAEDVLQSLLADYPDLLAGGPDATRRPAALAADREGGRHPRLRRRLAALVPRPPLHRPGRCPDVHHVPGHYFWRAFATAAPLRSERTQAGPQTGRLALER
jgi:hypothetical protein